jgi:hypothetical protein
MAQYQLGFKQWNFEDVRMIATSRTELHGSVLFLYHAAIHVLLIYD